MSVILDSIKSHIETSQTVLKGQQSFINMLCFSHLKIHEDFNQNNETTLHQRNLLVLIAEIHKMVNNIFLPIMPSLFEIRENTHNTRHNPSPF